MESKDTENISLKELESSNIVKETQILGQIYTIWNNVGVDEEQKVNRATQVWGYVFNLLKDILDEEVGFYEDIKERIKNYEKKVVELLSELGLPADEEISGTLIIKEEILRQRLDELLKMKHKRMKEYQELHMQESRYCKILGMPPLELSSMTGVPSEENIYELRQHVNMLIEEKARRQKKFHMLKKELTTIIEITELTPETPLEKEILTSREDSISLSNETFKVLEQFVTKTKCKKADLENEKASLMDKLSVLWDVLKVEKEERDAFLSKNTGCKVSNLNAIKQEIGRCEEIKRQNISKYVDALKEELASLFDKCFISKSEKKLSLMQEDEVNETLLEAYDNEVAKWRKYYKETEHIIKKINRRGELWNLMTVIEKRANDPNRFKNRGGNLLQEERDRKKLQKDLPALESEIFTDIKNFEEETGKRFLYYGDDFEAVVTKQWDERDAKKENERIMKQKLRARQLEDDQKIGTTMTPLKRSHAAPVPKSAPSKLFKSSVGVSIYRTPGTSVSRRMPSTVAKMKTKTMLKNSTKISENNVLKERNGNIAATSGSISLNSTTYTDFAEKLNRSSRGSHRSSVLCSKKIAGTRTSVGKKNKKDSINKSHTRKTNSSKLSSKLTPARGKLGLPFLI